MIPVGALEPRSIDVRFVAATNRDLEAEVERGTFRQDLYFRLNGISLTIPPLRERASEIEDLARTFLAEAARRLSPPRPLRLADDAVALLRRSPWPGNVRELKNVVERAALLCADDVVAVEHLSLGRQATEPPPRDGEEERAWILNALAQCGGNQTQAARRLGISRGTLVSRLKAYGIRRPRAGSDS